MVVRVLRGLKTVEIKKIQKNSEGDPSRMEPNQEAAHDVLLHRTRTQRVWRYREARRKGRGFHFVRHSPKARAEQNENVSRHDTCGPAESVDLITRGHVCGRVWRRGGTGVNVTKFWRSPATQVQVEHKPKANTTAVRVYPRLGRDDYA